MYPLLRTVGDVTQAQAQDDGTNCPTTLLKMIVVSPHEHGDRTCGDITGCFESLRLPPPQDVTSAPEDSASQVTDSPCIAPH